MTYQRLLFITDTNIDEKFKQLLTEIKSNAKIAAVVLSEKFPSKKFPSQHVMTQVQKTFSQITKVTIVKDQLSILHLKEVMKSFKNLQKIVLSIDQFHFWEIFDEEELIWKENHIKVLEVRCKQDFFHEKYLLDYAEMFPKLEKLVIDPWENNHNFDQR